MYLETIEENVIIFTNPNLQLFHFKQNHNEYNYRQAYFKNKQGT